MSEVRREGYKFCQDIRIPCYETDSAAFLKPASFMDRAQEIAYWAARELGFGYDQLHVHHTAWVLSRMHFHIEEAPKWGDGGMRQLQGYKDLYAGPLQREACPLRQR